MTIPIDKNLIRKTINAKRKQLSADIVEAHSTKIIDTITKLPAYKNSEAIGVYFGFAGEVNLRPLALHALREQKKVFAPVMIDHALHFYACDDLNQLHKNAYGIEEPNPDVATPILIENLDLIFVPVVAFDCNAHRLGRGKGYYDRACAFTLEHHFTDRPCLIGVAYELQKVGKLPLESWDVPLDQIISEETVYTRSLS